MHHTRLHFNLLHYSAQIFKAILWATLMHSVKGTAVTNYKVVPDKPIRNAVFRTLYVVICVGLVVTAYWYGFGQGLSEEKELLKERTELKKELTLSLEREAQLRQQVAVLENASIVDKSSTDSVRTMNRELSDRIAELEEENALYQGIMSPTLNTSGLTIQEVSLGKTASQNRYRFKVMLTQVGNNSDYLRGFVGINILGVQNSEITAYSLKDLSDDITDVDIKFRYRYFQDFKGELVLPDGFTPDQIQVVAQSVGNKSARVEESFEWSDLENENNVGQ